MSAKFKRATAILLHGMQDYTAANKESFTITENVGAMVAFD